LTLLTGLAVWLAGSAGRQARAVDDEQPLLSIDAAAHRLPPTACQPTASPVSRVNLPSDEDDWSQLKAQMRVDLNRYTSRELARTPAGPTPTVTTQTRDREFAAKATAMFAPLSRMSLRMPVVGIGTSMLEDSWHAPRDGGRVHRESTFRGEGHRNRRGDRRRHQFHRRSETRRPLHLADDRERRIVLLRASRRWPRVCTKGWKFRAGDLLGYVGNTGNAKYTPSHLHFGVDQNDEMVNPYPLLTHAVPTLHAHMHTTLSGGPVATR